MNKNVKVSNPMKVITGPDTRWSYANVWEPKSINGGTPMKLRLSITQNLFKRTLNGNLQAYMLMMVFPVPTLKTETSLIA